MYSVDWQKYVRDKIPSPVRKPVFEAFLNALLAPVKLIHSTFLLFRTNTLEQVRITPHKRVLQYWLNEKFDIVNREIEIRDYPPRDKVFIFLESENRPVYLPEFLGGSDFEFEVRVPIEYQDKQTAIENFLNTYKLPTKRYLIVWI